MKASDLMLVIWKKVLFGERSRKQQDSTCFFPWWQETRGRFVIFLKLIKRFPLI